MAVNEKLAVVEAEKIRLEGEVSNLNEICRQHVLSIDARDARLLNCQTEFKLLEDSLEVRLRETERRLNTEVGTSE